MVPCILAPDFGLVGQKSLGKISVRMEDGVSEPWARTLTQTAAFLIQHHALTTTSSFSFSFSMAGWAVLTRP